MFLSLVARQTDGGWAKSQSSNSLILERHQCIIGQNGAVACVPDGYVAVSRLIFYCNCTRGL